jgi:putative toxin-antitoxin system antitoxin component (TIGR02293 family)
MAFTETPTDLQRVAALLGGPRVLRRRLDSALDTHDLLTAGLPAPALRYLVTHLRIIQSAGSLEKAIGMSLRTYQRHRDGDTRPLSAEQSGRTWKFAEILAQATAIFGSQEEAEQWLERPAMSLGRRRPIDLLASPAGVELVQDHLTRLEYGVYT